MLLAVGGKGTVGGVFAVLDLGALRVGDDVGGTKMVGVVVRDCPLTLTLSPFGGERNRTDPACPCKNMLAGFAGGSFSKS